ncbi:MAG: FAD-binding protein, partial [Planctomycetota bacterium]
MKNHGTWRIGGPADLLVEPSDPEQLSRVLAYTSQNKIPTITIGEGSNLLFSDDGLRGLAIKIGRKMSAYNIDGNQVQAEAGIAVPRLARAVGLAGLTGMEHTVGIPGTLGGLIAMNGGSQRKSIGDVIRHVEVTDRQGRIRQISQDECEFSYRHSVFQGLDVIIARAYLKLQQGDRASIHAEMLQILTDRREKSPRRMPNCGSVFVSGGEIYERFGPPGKVIEEA